jgi:predicted RNA methylase
VHSAVRLFGAEKYQGVPVLTAFLLDRFRLFKHFFSSTRKRGLGRTIRISAYELWYERKFGGNTALVIPTERLDYSEEGRRHAEPYFPSSFLFLREIFFDSRIDCRNAVFVDYGCGMGRTLLFASTLPFKRLIGVELSLDLCRIAHENMNRFYVREGKQTPEWLIVNADAKDFRIPESANIFYMYNPFDASILGRVIDRIVESIVTAPRTCTLVYANPQHEWLLRDRGMTKLFGKDDDFAVYAIAPRQAADAACIVG